MMGILAIVEREMRKFFRSPALILMTWMMPLLTLVIMGNSFGGKIVGTRVALIDNDHGPHAVKIREACDSIAANIGTFRTVAYSDEKQAYEDVQNGRIDAAIIIPAHYSRHVFAQDAPRLGLIVDNSDQFTSGSLEGEMQSLVDALNAPVIQPRLAGAIALRVVETYPYVNYMKFLLPAIVAMAMYVSVMIGGGIVYIDDKAQGVHEGYLVTPITRLELVLGMNLAGTLKCVLAGVSVTFIGSWLAGLPVLIRPLVVVELLGMIVAAAIAFNGMMFLLMVRVDNPMVPRALSGFLNVLLFYPSGSIYPIAAFPFWLRAIAVVNPFTYCIHGFRSLLTRSGGFLAIRFDLLFLLVFGLGTLAISIPMFKRTL